MQSLNYRNFYVGLILSFILAVILFILSYTIGKNNFFLLLNGDLGTGADYFFGIITNAGDALMWIFVLIIVILMKRKDLIWLIIWAFIFTTVFTQVCKYLIVPDEARPWTAVTDHSLIHYVSFITPWLTASFPSGHTATAFTFYLLFCLILKNNSWIFTGLLYAIVVGFSRIYLAQHFPFDVAGGIITSIISVYFSLVMFKKINGKG